MEQSIRRPKVQIIAEILDFCKKPRYKTNVMEEINLSWGLLQKYLSYLESLGFLKIQQNSRKLVTTQEGLEFVRRWKDMMDLILPTSGIKKERLGTFS